MVSPMKSEYGNNFSDEVTGWLTEELWIDSQQWQHIFGQLRNFQNNWYVHPASSVLHINDIFLGIKQPLLQANKTHPFSADVKSE
jgi:hypothetical protein